MASHHSGPKKPRLSLQINPAVDQAARAPRGFLVNPQDPTTFNTLSNAYVTAIERSTPVTAINTLQAFTLNTPAEYKDSKFRVTTPYVANYPETPLTAHADSPPQFMEINYPSAMTATPPLSAAPSDANSAKVFTFSVADTSEQPSMQTLSSPVEARTPRRRQAPFPLAGLGLQPPYNHPRALHSILRNSPLPPRTAIPPQSPRRQSLRLQEKANKKVEYNSPLTQDIVTLKYTKSHIDLLVEEASPSSPASLPSAEPDLSMAFAPNEIEDGGQTPGPFEDMRRRMASLSSSTPLLSPAAGPNGIRKRKRKEKKRRWVWTIGQDDEEVEVEVGAGRKERARSMEDDARTPRAPAPYLQTPTPSIESDVSAPITESFDVEMSDTSSNYSEDYSLAPGETELGLKTPTAPRGLRLLSEPPYQRVQDKGDTPIPELEKNRDTPVPPEMSTG